MSDSDFLALSGLTTSPGQPTDLFDPSLLSYSVVTGYDNISISVMSSASAIINMNGVNRSSIVLNLSVLQPVNVSVMLQSSSFGCFSPHVYELEILQSL